MGLGTDLIREDSPEHAAAIDNFKEQFLLALVRRYGPVVDIPVAEIDDTGGHLMLMGLIDTAAGPTFRFEVRKKQ